MKRYEATVILLPTLTEDAQKELVEKYKKIVDADGKFLEAKAIGKRRLAYEIKKQKEGIYICFTFDSNPDNISEIQRNFRIDDNILKFLVIAIDEKKEKAHTEAKAEEAKKDEE